MATMNASLVLMAALAIAVGNAAHAQSLAPASCEMQLAVRLTPDVANPSDAGFLSSLLTNETSYELKLQRQEPGSIVVLDLTGPGSAASCSQVVETMRRDARVQSVNLRAHLTR